MIELKAFFMKTDFLSGCQAVSLRVFFLSNLVELLDFCNFRALPWCFCLYTPSVFEIIFANKILITYPKKKKKEGLTLSINFHVWFIYNNKRYIKQPLGLYTLLFF